jgi:hypothetical protein
MLLPLVSLAPAPVPRGNALPAALPQAVVAQARSPRSGLCQVLPDRAGELRVELAAVSARRRGDGELPDLTLAVQQRVDHQELLRMDLDRNAGGTILLPPDVAATHSLCIMYYFMGERSSICSVYRAPTHCGHGKRWQNSDSLQKVGKTQSTAIFQASSPRKVFSWTWRNPRGHRTWQAGLSRLRRPRDKESTYEMPEA